MVETTIDWYQTTKELSQQLDRQHALLCWVRQQLMLARVGGWEDHALLDRVLDHANRGAIGGIAIRDLRIVVHEEADDESVD